MVDLTARHARDLSAMSMALLALPCLPLALLQGPAGGILASIYVSHFGLSLTVVGTVTLVTRLFDAVTDPLIGLMSDRTRSRFGRRKPLAVFGALLTAVATAFVFMPPPAPSQTYFLVSFLTLYLGWTFCEIPLAAWAAEVTGSAQTRNRIFLLRWTMTSIGWALMFAIPYLPVFETPQITPQTLVWMGWIGLVGVPVTVLLAAAFVPVGADLAVRFEHSVAAFLRAAARNPPFHVFLGAALLTGVGTGVYFALNFLYFTQVLGYRTGFTLIGLVTALVAIPAYVFWTRVSNRLGHYRMWSISAAAIGFAQMAIAVLPAGEAYFPYALVAACIGQIAASGWWVGLGPILADCADYDLLKTGVNRAGQYFAAQAFVTKVTNGLGGSVAFLLLATVGYDPAHVQADGGGSADTGFRWVIGGFPAAAAFASAVLVLRFPITPRRQRIIRRRIERRAARRPSTEATL